MEYFKNVKALRERATKEAKENVEKRKAKFEAETNAARTEEEKRRFFENYKGKHQRDVEEETEFLLYKKIHENILRDFGTRLQKFRNDNNFTQEKMTSQNPLLTFLFIFMRNMVWI